MRRVCRRNLRLSLPVGITIVAIAMTIATIVGQPTAAICIGIVAIDAADAAVDAAASGALLC